jgi:DNA repair exonuclease SbcCD ATPase subunit
VLAALTGCTGLAGPTRASGNQDAAQQAMPPPSPPLATYLETLSRMAPGNPERQQAELDSTRARARQSGSSADTLRYALALGSAGHTASDPVEARRVIAELLAGPNTLQPAEAELAAAYLREFDARVALYAELGRQREVAEQQLRQANDAADRRFDTLAGEYKQLKRALAAAEQKLEAVAEMERSLLEQPVEAEPEAPPRP